MKTIAIAGTFDTKGDEFAYIRDLFREQGLDTLMIHTGVFDSKILVDIDHSEIARAAGYRIEDLARDKDRAKATAVMAKGMEILIPQIYREGRFDGIISMGGSGGTAVAAPAMRALPLGVPKMLVSTMASGNVSRYVGTSDIIMMPSVVDVAGVNGISKMIFKNAVSAMSGMIKGRGKAGESICQDKPRIAATMFGVTTPCVTYAKEYLEQRGYEVIIFHATGTGGRTMERLIREGWFAGVLDLTTTEWCDELFGGILAAGPHRCEAAAQCHVPQVISVGAVDMVNFGPPETVPQKYAHRKLYRHNPMVTLMRTTEDENRRTGKVLVEKINMASERTALLLPLRGVSGIDSPGQPFYGPEEDRALFDTLRKEIDRDKIEIIEMENNINDPGFAAAAAQKLVELIEGTAK